MGNEGWIEPSRVAHPIPAAPQRSLTEIVVAMMTRNGRIRLEEESRLHHAAKLQDTTLGMAVTTGTGLDRWRDGSEYVDRMVDDSQAQLAVERSGVNADYFRRSNR